MTQDQSSYALIIAVLIFLYFMPESWRYWLPFALWVGVEAIGILIRYKNREQDRIEEEKYKREWEKYRKNWEKD